MPFDECKIAAWVDTEGNITIFGTKQFPRFSAIVRVAQKEREPLSEYCQYVSARFGLRCTVAKVASCYQAEHVATLEFLDAIEPLMETDNKKRQIAEARKLYAERVRSSYRKTRRNVYDGIWSVLHWRLIVIH